MFGTSLIDFIWIGISVAHMVVHANAAFANNKHYAKCVRYCDICDLSFKKVAEYDRHVAGKRHLDQLQRTPSAQQLWGEISSCPSIWHAECDVEDLIPKWSYDELSSIGLKYRSNCLHPTPVLSKLNPKQKSRVWRYMRDVMGQSYYSEIAAVMAAVDADIDGHMRVKEVFESFETYKRVANFIIITQRTLKSIGSEPIQRIVELACGHGLVGALLAYRFPHMEVHLYDLHRRPTFNAFLRAFEMYGHRRPDKKSVLPNIFFHEADLRTATDKIPSSVVVCIHGCGPANKDAIEMAKEYNACGWVVMPCCINRDMYLGAECAVQLSDDDARHVMLCGALANKYEAQLIESIDTRITNRAIVIAGGVGLDVKREAEQYNDDDNDLRAAAKRGRLPKLLQ